MSAVPRAALCFVLIATCAVIATEVGLAVAASPVVAQSARRGIPRRLRDGLVGCHQLGDHEQMVIERVGTSGLRARWTATGRGGIVERHSAMMFHRAELDAVEIGCGAQSQHGQYCLFSIDASGALHGARVSRYSRRATPITLSACR